MTHPSKNSLTFWFCLSLSVSATYAGLALQKAFSSAYVIQDDARQHVFWMQRFLDADLFPNDLIADYFQSVAPAGYTALYHIMAAWGMSPILLHKLLPMVLGAIATAYGFHVCLQLFPVPFAGFLATLLLNQSLWMQDGLISATPKAFIYPLFLAFLYYWLDRHLLGTCVSIIFLGLFYPQGVLIAAGIFSLRVMKWVTIKKFLQQSFSKVFCNSQERRGVDLPYDRFSVIALLVAFVILLPYAVNVSELGPTIARSQAAILPEFLPKGRSQFFVQDSWQFWFHGRSGIGLATIFTPVFTIAGFLLPMMQRFGDRFALTQKVQQNVVVLPQLAISSLGLFFIAHVFLFRLHLPSRYTQHTLRIVMALAAAIALTILIDTLWSFGRQSRRKFVFVPVIAVVLLGLIFYPQLAMSNFPWTYYQIGQQPELYEFFQQQPKDSLIASLSEEANNLPTFAQRSILTGREYAVPYHWGYYRQLRERTLDLIQAQYSPNLAAVQEVIKKYNVTFWLVDRGAFTPGYLAPNTWLNQYQVTADAIARLSSGQVPAISHYLDRCSVFESNGLVVLKASCLIDLSD